MKEEEVDRLLDTPVPGGSQARDWFLPHDTSRGRENVRDVVRRMVESAHGPTDSLKHERDCLAQGIKDAAVKAGICRADANLSTADLLVLCDQMAQGLMHADRAIDAQRPVPTRGAALSASAPSPLGLYVVGVGYTMDGERHNLGEWKGLAPDAASARELALDALWDERLDAGGACAHIEVYQALRFAVCEDWGHVFSSEPESRVTNTRWVIDRATGGFVEAQAQNLEEGPDSWQDLSAVDAADLLESLGHNFEIMDSAGVMDFGVDLVHVPPAWACEVSQTLVDDQSVAEIAYTDTQVDQLASLFLQGLAADIGLERLRMVAKANEVESNQSICHTHDACDANVVMAAAFELVIGVSVDLRSSSQAQLWDLAWKKAKEMMLEYVQQASAELENPAKRERQN